MKLGKALTKHTKCPFCGHVHDLVSSAGIPTRLPGNGDIGLCIRCGEWVIYDDAEGGMRKPTHPEYEDIITNKVCAKLRWAWEQISAKSG